MDDPKNDADNDRRLTTDRRHPEDGSDSDDGSAIKLARLQERVDVHSVEIGKSREARETFIPRILVMEAALLKLSEEAVPKLTVAVEAMTKELIASRTSRKIILQVAAWVMAILTTVAGAVLSFKAIDVLEKRMAATSTATR